MAADLYKRPSTPRERMQDSDGGTRCMETIRVGCHACKSGLTILICGLDAGHDGELHHDQLDGVWWRAGEDGSGG